MEKLRVADAITEVFTIFKRCNKYIDETMPWALAKDEEKKDDNFSLDIPTIPEVTDVKPVTPVEIKEEPSKRPYDVEEILKIAKSPIVSMPEKRRAYFY